MKTTGKKINGRKVFTYVFLTIAALISLFPFYFMFVSATNTNAEILSATPKLIFGSHLVENFKNLNKKMDILRILMNSTIMTVTYTALSIILHSMAGYALAKFEFKGKGLLFSLIMVTMMIPSQVMYVPLFTLMNNIGWADTYQAVVLPGLAGAFGIFLMRQNMLAFPTSLIEAARIDGCGEIGIFLKVVLPSQKPAIGALGIYMFMYIAVLMNVVNIVCGYCFIFGAFGIPGMGIKGAATALLMAQAVGAGTGLYLLYKKKGGLFRKVPSEHRFFSFDKKCIYEIYTTGIPAALETVFWQVSAIILSKVILFYGNQAFAAYQLGIQAEEITEMPAIGFSTASTTLAARAIGMQDEELRKVYFKEQLKVGVFISSITSVLLIFLPRFFMTLMTDKPELQAIGVVYVFVMGFIQIPQNLSRIYNGTIRAMGYKNAPMLVAGFGIWIVRIPLCMLAAYVLRLPLTIIWIIIAMDQVSRFLLSVGLYYRINKKREQTMNAV